MCSYWSHHKAWTSDQGSMNFTILIEGLIRHHYLAFGFFKHRSREEYFLKLNTFSINTHIGLTLGLNPWHRHHEFHDLGRCLMDIILIRFFLAFVGVKTLFKRIWSLLCLFDLANKGQGWYDNKVYNFYSSYSRGALNQNW